MSPASARASRPVGTRTRRARARPRPPRRLSVGSAIRSHSAATACRALAVARQPVAERVSRRARDRAGSSAPERERRARRAPAARAGRGAGSAQARPRGAAAPAGVPRRSTVRRAAGREHRDLETRLQRDQAVAAEPLEQRRGRPCSSAGRRAGRCPSAGRRARTSRRPRRAAAAPPRASPPRPPRAQSSAAVMPASPPPITTTRLTLTPPPSMPRTATQRLLARRQRDAPAQHRVRARPRCARAAAGRCRPSPAGTRRCGGRAAAPARARGRTTRARARPRSAISAPSSPRVGSLAGGARVRSRLRAARRVAGGGARGSSADPRAGR